MVICKGKCSFIFEVSPASCCVCKKTCLFTYGLLRIMGITLEERSEKKQAIPSEPPAVCVEL